MYQEFIEIFEDDKTQSNIPISYTSQYDMGHSFWTFPW